MAIFNPYLWFELSILGLLTEMNQITIITVKIVNHTNRASFSKYWNGRNPEGLIWWMSF